MENQEESCGVQTLHSFLKVTEKQSVEYSDFVRQNKNKTVFCQ